MIETIRKQRVSCGTIVAFSVVIGLSGLSGCGDDSGSSSSNRPKPRKNSKKNSKKKKAAKGSIAAYPKVDDDLRKALGGQDFTPDASGKTNRDPFRSWVVSIVVDPNTVAVKLDICTEGKNVAWEARNYSIRDLELIGLVKRGRSYAQFRGGGDDWIVRKGDCLGQEKAIVEEISVKTVRLSISPPAPPGRPAPPAQYQNISLYPDELEIDSIVSSGNRTRDLR